MSGTDFELSDVNLHVLFDQFDIDQSGSIQSHEFESLADQAGIALPKERIDLLVAEFDLDHTGTIDFNEFRRMIGRASEEFVRATNTTLPTTIYKLGSQLTCLGLDHCDAQGRVPERRGNRRGRGKTETPPCPESLSSLPCICGGTLEVRCLNTTHYAFPADSSFYYVRIYLLTHLPT